MLVFLRCICVSCLFLLSAFSSALAQENIQLTPPLLIEMPRRDAVSAADKVLYTQMFDHLENGEYDAAKERLTKVENDLLTGYAFAHIYLSEDYTSTKKELGDWLKKYIDLPIAEEVYELAAHKKALLPKKKPYDPAAHMAAGSCTSMRIADPIDLIFYKRASYVPEPDKAKVRRSMQYFSSAIRRGKTLAAKLHLNERHVKKHLSQRDRDDSLTALAFAYFIDRQDQLAWNTIQEPLKRSTDRNPMAPWVAGLTAFRLEKWEEAEENFKRVAAHPKSIPTLKSAGAFWTTRLLMRNEKYREINEYLRQAALASPRSFYGILAQRALGWSIGHSWKRSALEEPDMDVIFSEKAGRRAVALVQIGQMELAEKELIKLYAEKKNMRKQLLAYAETVVEYPDLSVRLASLSGEIETPDGDNALYPFPNWIPTNGWQVDQALIYAFVRQESCFKNKAFSKAGARGVMQLMPSTARLMAARLGVKYQLSRLHRIPYNLMVGQELVRTLLNFKSIDGNLLMTIAAYNAGPRNSVKWKNRPDFMDDPLMFVEGIPSRETRGFVKKVMANYWIYRSLFNQDLSSIDDVLAGKYPIYHPE